MKIIIIQKKKTTKIISPLSSTSIIYNCFVLYFINENIHNCRMDQQHDLYIHICRKTVSHKWNIERHIHTYIQKCGRRTYLEEFLVIRTVYRTGQYWTVWWLESCYYISNWIRLTHGLRQDISVQVQCFKNKIVRELTSILTYKK